MEHIKKRRKKIRLPVDLAGKNGEFPEPNAPLKERVEQIKFLRGYLNDISRGTANKVVNTAMKVLQERRIKNNPEFYARNPELIRDYDKDPVRITDTNIIERVNKVLGSKKKKQKPVQTTIDVFPMVQR